MPNHITTSLTITGCEERVAHALNFIKPTNPSHPEESVIDFEKVVKPPNTPEYHKTGWYDWNTEHWGTKWNAYNQEQRDDNTIAFDTAWNFAEPVIRRLSELYPDLDFGASYIDELWNFAGRSSFSEGKRIYHEDVECAPDNEDFIDLHTTVLGYPLEQNEEIADLPATAYGE